MVAHVFGVDADPPVAVVDGAVLVQQVRQRLLQVVHREQAAGRSASLGVRVEAAHN